MKTISKIGVGAIALTMLATTPAAAQSYRDRDRDNTGRDAVLGAVAHQLHGRASHMGDADVFAGHQQVVDVG